MNTKLKYVWITIVIILTLGFSQFAAARDLIVVASKATQEASQDWFGFLESKEIPVKKVTPDSFNDVKNELYIIVLGSLDESNEIKEIAKDALTDDEFKSLSGAAKMFYKPQAWNVGQKVILILGPDKDAVKETRVDSQEKWYEMLQEWFDIEDSQGFHLY